MKICEIHTAKNGKQYVEDYRLKNKIEFRKGRLNDLKNWYVKSSGLGDLVSCIPQNYDTKDLCIIEHSGGYVLGVA